MSSSKRGLPYSDYEGSVGNHHSSGGGHRDSRQHYDTNSQRTPDNYARWHNTPNNSLKRPYEESPRNHHNSRDLNDHHQEYRHHHPQGHSYYHPSHHHSSGNRRDSNSTTTPAYKKSYDSFYQASTSKKSRLLSKSRSFSTRTRSKSPSSSDGKDDSVGHLHAKPGDIINGRCMYCTLTPTTTNDVVL